MADEIKVDANTAALERREAAKAILTGGGEEDTTNRTEEEDVDITDKGEVVPRTEEVVEEEEPEGGELEEDEEDEEGTEEDEEGEPGEENDDDDEEVEVLVIDDVEVPVEVVEVHHRMVNDLVEALDGTSYPIDFTEDGELTEESVEKGMAELGARLSDAHSFYAVLDGTQPIDDLFGRLKQFQGQQAHDFLANKALEYFVKIGLVDGPGAEDTTPNNGAFTDPILEENKRLKKQLAEQSVGSTQAEVGQRKVKIYNSAVEELKRLGAEEGIDEDLLNDSYLPAMAKLVGGDKAIINRIARGNFVDVKRIFDLHHSKIVGLRTRVQKNRVGSRKIRDRRVPRNVAGGDKPGSASVKKTYDLSTSEGRRAAAKDNLRG